MWSPGWTNGFCLGSAVSLLYKMMSHTKLYNNADTTLTTVLVFSCLLIHAKWPHHGNEDLLSNLYKTYPGMLVTQMKVTNYTQVLEGRHSMLLTDLIRQKNLLHLKLFHK